MKSFLITVLMLTHVLLSTYICTASYSLQPGLQTSDPLMARLDAIPFEIPNILYTYLKTLIRNDLDHQREEARIRMDILKTPVDAISQLLMIALEEQELEAFQKILSAHGRNLLNDKLPAYYNKKMLSMTPLGYLTLLYKDKKILPEFHAHAYSIISGNPLPKRTIGAESIRIKKKKTKGYTKKDTHEIP